MKHKNILVSLVFLAGLSLADDIDAELVSNLDFFANMDVIENLDQVETTQVEGKDLPQTKPSTAEKTKANE